MITGTAASDVEPGELVWAPDADEAARAAITRFIGWLADHRGVTLPDYQALHRWSIDDLEAFWGSLFTFEAVLADGDPTVVLANDSVEHAVWFPGLRLNFAEHVFRDRDPAAVALVCVPEDSATRGATEVTWGALAARVASLARTLRGFGVREGDRVAGYLPNAEAAVVGLLAAASIGAVWSVCSPDLGADGMVGRIGPLEPSVLIAVDGYVWGGKHHDRRDEVSAVLTRIPSIRQLIHVSSLGLPAPAFDGVTVPWEEATTGAASPEFARVAFSAPLWVLFSSGTTGAPKGIVHSHGGTLLEQLKTHHLQFDERPGDRFLYVGSTSWMVWNLMVSALLVGTTIVLVDGNPVHPSLERPFAIAAEHRVTQLGIGAGLVHAAMRSGLSLRDRFDLGALRNLSVTGSPLAVAGFGWLRDNLPENTWQSTASGGTDICSAFVGSAPTVPTLAGRFQSISLGVALESWDQDGHPLIGEKGELVVTKPMPSMPIAIWGDPSGRRLHDSYFATYPGVWRHGDFITVYPDGTSVIHGRSDATLNRQGVRIGPADITTVVEEHASVAESMVIGVERAHEYDMILFVVPTGDPALDELALELRAGIRARLSPRHVPDQVLFVDAVPHTRTGKKLEIPVKRLFQGDPIDAVADPTSIDDPAALQALADIARQWIADRGARIPRP